MSPLYKIPQLKENLVIDMDERSIEDVLIEYGVPDHMIPEIARMLEEKGIEAKNMPAKNSDELYLAYIDEGDWVKKAQLAARMISKGIDA